MADIEADELDVRVLEETLTKVDSLTDQISKSLYKLAKSSHRAERNIKPISGKTRDLQIYGTNLESSLNVIAEIKDYAKLSAEYEKTVQAGPDKVQLDAYIRAVEELDKSLQKLKQTDLKSFYKVASRMEQLVRQGNAQLKDYYGYILDQVYKPIEVGEYLKSGKPMPTISHDHISKLRRLAKHFEKTKQRGSDAVYTEKASNYILSSIGPLAKSTRPKPSKTYYAKGSNTIHVYTAALKGLLQAEFFNLQELYSGNQSMQSRMFEQLCGASISEYCDIANTLDGHVNRNMNTDSMLIFELIACDGILINEIQEICKAIPSRLRETMDKNCSTAHASLSAFIQFIDTRIMSIQQLPSDNGVSDACVDIMSRLGRLAEYKESELVAISTMTPGSWIPKPAPAWASQLPPNNSPLIADPYEKLSSFFCDAIDAIVLGLEFKSKTSGKKNSQTGFFMLMNLTVIEQFVRQKDMHKILGDSGFDRLERLRKRGLNLFIDSWKQAAAYLMDVTVVKPGSDKLSSKDREAVKEKFKLFNAEFEQLVQRHKAYNLKDQGLKEALAKEIFFISPLYHRFYDKHCGGDFTKNVDKYIKWNKDQFDDVLRSLG